MAPNVCPQIPELMSMFHESFPIPVQVPLNDPPLCLQELSLAAWRPHPFTF